jgi:hypothetical protein
MVLDDRVRYLDVGICINAVQQLEQVGMTRFGKLERGSGLAAPFFWWPSMRYSGCMPALNPRAAPSCFTGEKWR